MGKSPGKWIKTVLFGKKSSKSNLSKDVTAEIKTAVAGKAETRDFGADPMVISSPVRPVIASSGENTEMENNSSVNLMPDTAEHIGSPVDLNPVSGEELIRLEQAATKAQAAFRGYLARRAFWALKGIIRLQALVRGHLVRRQAVATLSCMRAMIEFQALVRGRRVRLSDSGQTLQKCTPRKFLDKKPADLLGASLRVEKLSTNVFATKLVASSHTTMPLSFQYESDEPNSVRHWLDRWSSSCFWEPLPQPKKTLDPKPKRKQAKMQAEEIEIGRPKRSVRRTPAANGDNSLSNSSENEKSRRTVRKVNHQADSGQEQSINELEKVKRNLRKISLSTSAASEKSETNIEKPLPSMNKEIPEQETNNPPEKVNGLSAESDKQPDPKPESEPEPEPEELSVQPPEDKPLDVLQEDHSPIEPPSQETNGKHEEEAPANVESNGKENHKARRRKSLPAKQEYHESVSQNTPTLPSYMAATESAKAKLRAQAAAKAAEEGAENGFTRRQSLPSATAKPSLHSPRVQKPLHANGKGGSKPNKSQISPRDEKVIQSGWRR
uniref:protein IQ-DOMAIN 31-like n=1 Tax=Erigeron canadensis TaxID=72917 RepID=UPI001CB922D0|nr:protein IQ-DOMAIN 31-like [Erigeron canadensis]XP_043632271.1 protein IQ-DOMAIN 31-like [Erigeron canadensis]